MQAKSLGYRGENLAAQYLRSKGYEIIKNNFTIRGGEIDLIAKYEKILVFIEVKTRTTEQFGSGEESIDFLKKHRIHRTIKHYISNELTESDPDYRLDFIDIELDPKTKKLKKIQHFEDIEL